MMRVDDAERQGRVAAALRLMEEMPDGPDGRRFWRPWRVERLVQLRLFRPAMPSWAHSRWLLEQALQHYDARTADISRRAWSTALRVRGGHEALREAYPVDAATKLIDHDWVYRQCHLYDLGGLATFLRTAASPDLVRRADDVRQWARTPMGGYLLVARGSATTTFEDLADGRPFETPNIGSAALLAPGEHVIGRLVPFTSGRVFESVPLQVPEELARSVARDPSSWLTELEETIRQAPIPLHFHRFGFISDLPADIAAAALHDSDDFSSAAIARTLVRTVDTALRGELDWGDEDVDPWACFASLIQTPTILHALANEPLASDAKVITRLGLRLAEPSAQICRDLADALRQAA